MRSFRVPIVLLQLYVRRAILNDRPDLRHLLRMLPKGRYFRNITRILSDLGFTRDDLIRLTWVLEGRNDDERCRRFLELQMPRPPFLLLFLLREKSHITDSTLLGGLIEYAHKFYDGSIKVHNTDAWSTDEVGRAKRYKYGMDAELFISLLDLLASKCAEVESRLVVKVSDLAIQFIRNLQTRPFHPGYVFHQRCQVFNAALVSIGRDLKDRPPRFVQSQEYVWHAVRSLLSESTSFQRPLQMEYQSFRAVRETLARMPKSQSERHNSARHAESWPPYLKAGNGMDEMVVPDENWTRAVQAGVLQQEAGYSKTVRDEVLDTLQGVAPDGTPTIQQRLARVPRHMTPWEASIRATRNAEEAWLRFQRPPRRGQHPGPFEYAAMFKKLFQKTVWKDDDGPMIQPGDRDLSFPTQSHLNLSDYAMASLKPPTVEQLYTRMILQGIRPRSTLLNVLVANAGSVKMAHKYLEDSRTNCGLTSLSKNEFWHYEICTVPIELLAAYVYCCCGGSDNTGGKLTHGLSRAISITLTRLNHDPTSAAWAPYLWGSIFRALTVPNPRYETVIGRIDQFELILDQLEPSAVDLPFLLQLCRGLRKAIVGKTNNLIDQMESGRKTNITTIFVQGEYLRHPENQVWSAQQHQFYQNFQNMRSRLKGTLEMLISREKAAKDVLEGLNVEEVDLLDRILARRDPIRAKDAFNVMICFAFIGEFEQMATYLVWLAEEWGRAEVQDRLAEEGQLPRMANFADVLCTFRLFAEPMLPEQRVAEVRAMVDQAGQGWDWPTTEDVAVLREMYPSGSFRKLAHALKWARYWKMKAEAEQGAHEGGPVNPPKTWEAIEANAKARAEAASA